MSWDLLFGFAGEVNFGPTFLIGLGAYGAGLMNNAGSAIPLCLAGGAGAAVVGGVALALPALRLRGPYFGLITLVAVLLLLDCIVIFAGVTGGEIGMMVPDVLSISARVNYWYAFGFLVISALILFGLSRSSLGLILQATGQDRIEAAALGFNVTKHKLAAFCISALFSGLAGGHADVLRGHRLGRYGGRSVDRGADHHRRGIRRPAHHPGRRAGRDLPRAVRRTAAPASASSTPSSCPPSRSLVITVLSRWRAWRAAAPAGGGG